MKNAIVLRTTSKEDHVRFATLIAKIVNTVVSAGMVEGDETSLFAIPDSDTPEANELLSVLDMIESKAQAEAATTGNAQEVTHGEDGETVVRDLPELVPALH